MNWTERVFVIVLILSGSVFLYIMSLFSSSGSNQSPDDADFYLPSDEAEIQRAEEIPFRHSSRNSVFSAPTVHQNSYEKPRQAPRSNPINLNADDTQDEEYTSLIPIRVRQNSMLKKLKEMGLGPNETFSEYLLESVRKSEWLKEKSRHRRYMRQQNYSAALELSLEILAQTPESNPLLKVELVSTSLEAAMLAGETELASSLLEQQADWMEVVVSAMENSSIMRFHKGRERVDQMKDNIRRARSGSVMSFFEAMQQGQVSPVEVMTAAKANAANQRSQADFEISDSMIQQAGQSTEQLFQRLKE